MLVFEIEWNGNEVWGLWVSLGRDELFKVCGIVE